MPRHPSLFLCLFLCAGCTKPPETPVASNAEAESAKASSEKYRCVAVWHCKEDPCPCGQTQCYRGQVCAEPDRCLPSYDDE